DWKVESLCGYPFKCFLDPYKGYHQIQMVAADEEKTAFHTGQGVYYYTKMSFGLKNAATYQRLMDKAFENQMGQNIEVYVDDLVVKSHTEAEMVRDIEETFQTLRKINMKLNPKKCSFGLAEGVFLGYVITPEGIKPCPNKTAATLKKCIKKSDFRWTKEAEQAFQQLKQHLSALPLLAAPKPQEELIMYLSATHGAISAVLMTERGTVQTPVYFISHGSGARLILTNPDGIEFTYALRFQFAASNNEAEYEALIASLRIVMQMGVKNIQANVDSKLVANQVLGTKRSDSSSRGRRSNLDDRISELLERRALSGRVDESQISDSRNGLLHKVDRSKSGGNDYRRTSEEIRMGQYCMPFWYSRRNNLRQRQTSNRLVERANISLGEGIKARLREGNKNWVEELPHVLWSHRTMIKSSHGDTPFSLTYRTEAVIPAEIRMPTYRTTTVDVVNNDEELRLNLDLLEERRELAAMSEARSKSKMMKYYNSRVRSVAFKPGDFIYRSNDASHAVAGGKLGPK
nr:reverse transcriptase domain-containing protein [Tanacetum cinerariifolium]